jgi:hypothetical protein
MAFDFNKMNSRDEDDEGDGDEDRGETNWRTAARHRAARLGTIMVTTAILCALSNGGLLVLGHLARKFNEQQDGQKQPPPNVRQEDRKNFERGKAAAPLFDFVCLALFSLVYLPAFLGGMALQRGSSGSAYAGAIMLLLPCSPGFLLGLPVGIWALVVLGEDDVKEFLAQQARREQRGGRRRRRRRRDDDYDDED